FFEIKGLRENNLKNINVKIPLNIFTVITGVSGSGKSTLIKKIIYPAVQRELNIFKDKPGDFDTINGNISKIKQIEYIDQNPIGKSSRSNPVTYIKAYDEIRKVFSNQKLSKLRGLKPKHFSFNVPGGRCEKCQGEGSLNIEMQFMADVKIVCDECNGKRFKKEILEIYVRDKSINDILNLSINEAIDFFNENNNINISQKLLPLQKVGLGYILLGQSSSTLSGGEAQRVKLAYFLQKVNSKNHILFLFDEPTTGLHFHDIKMLLKSFNELLGLGHTLVVVEHNIDLIKCADNIIDLGPEGGENGGYIVAQGTPEDISKNKESLTGYYLKKKL
ncbi:MAG: excinuclease ABC subunit A, partial [Flavobacteriaceae bacterium]|nr:excinuclease ABC subunit A [Flavobacteriaceae bacterium]